MITVKLCRGLFGNLISHIYIAFINRLWFQQQNQLVQAQIQG